MKKLLLPFVITGSLLVLGGCTVDTVSYNDGYVDNVYTAGYYNTSPYWGNTYYTGYPGLSGVAWAGNWNNRWGYYGWNRGWGRTGLRHAAWHNNWNRGGFHRVGMGRGFGHAGFHRASMGRGFAHHGGFHGRR